MFIKSVLKKHAKDAIFIVILLLLTAGHSKAEQYTPETGRVWGQDQTDFLEYDCKMLSAERISCDFIQTLVAKADNSPDMYENELNRCYAEALGENESYDESICKYIKTTLELIDGLITENEFSERMGTSDVDFERLLRNQTNKETIRHRFSTSAPIMCAKTITKDQCIKMATAYSEERENTCNVITNSYSQTFVKANNTDKDIFTVETSANGPCGVINVSRFERDFNDYWDYISQKVVTNPSGQSMMGTCSELDEDTYEYSWKPEDGVVKNCKFVKFGH